MNTKYFITSILFMALAVQTNAMNSVQEIAEAIGEQFGDFTTIDHQAIAEAIYRIPAQSTLWGCGLHQSAHALTFLKCEENIADFSTPGDYPLSVNANVRTGALASLLAMPLINSVSKNIQTDTDGNFRVGPTPHELAHFINDFLKEPIHSAQAISQDDMSAEQLLEIVASNIAKSLPTIAYFVVNPKAHLLHVYSIVGYNDDGVLVLDSHENGVARLLAYEAEDFVAHMNAGGTIGLVKMIDLAGGLVGLRGKIVEGGGRVVAKNILAKWKAYSVVSFVDTNDLIEVELENEDKNCDCVIQ